MAVSRTNAHGKSAGKSTTSRNGKSGAGVPQLGLYDEEKVTPLAIADALGRTALETCRQRDRRARLSQLGATKLEVNAAEALVDTCDLALAECVQEFEKHCGKEACSDDTDVRQAASAMWLAAREYLRRMSIAEKASRQLTQHTAEKFGDLHLEFEFEASALLAMKQATDTYTKLRQEPQPKAKAS